MRHSQVYTSDKHMRETLLKGVTPIGFGHLPTTPCDVLLTDLGPVLFDKGTAEGGFHEVLNAEGLVLAPGFMDMHSHSDLHRFHPGQDGVPLGDRPKLAQGCTHQVLGQDGYSAAPVRRHDAADYAMYISGLDGELGTAFPWESFQEYVAANAAVPGTRTSHLVGHSTIRRAVMGMENRHAEIQDLDAMDAELDLALRSGARGLSTGLVYAPASFSNEAEVVRLCQVLARHDSVLFVHLRSESTNVMQAAEEVLEASRIAGSRLHISHIKTAGPANWHLTPKLIDFVQQYRDQGVSITADLHPYVAGSTMATVFLPPWFLDGGNDAVVHRLRDPQAVARARDQMLNDTASWDNWWQFSSGWEGIVFAEVHDRSLLGRPVSMLLSEAGITDQNSQEAFEWFFARLADSNMRCSIISFNNSEENIAQFMKLPYVSICTDGLINPHGLPHPRTHGTFPRLFRRFVNELGVLDLESAVFAASVRGREPLGLSAEPDVVLFDPLLIEDKATFENPLATPVGITGVWMGSRRVSIG
jgi:N-acyl-D-amino-acid deacylase